MFNMSKEIIIVLVIVLIIFGPTQLPKLGKMFGKTMKGLREGMDNPDGEDEPAAAKPEEKPKEVEAAAEDPAAELERLRSENAKLAEAAKKGASEDTE